MGSLGKLDFTYANIPAGITWSGRAEFPSMSTILFLESNSSLILSLRTTSWDLENHSRSTLARTTVLSGKLVLMYVLISVGNSASDIVLSCAWTVSPAEIINAIKPINFTFFFIVPSNFYCSLPSNFELAYKYTALVGFNHGT